MTRKAFVIDLKRCIGCDTCMVGCQVEHRLPEGVMRLQVLDALQTQTRRTAGAGHPSPSQHWLPTMCHHCSDAPCVTACPTTALWREESQGLVVLDKDKCVGCQRCAEVCPYDALSFDPVSGIADKCTGCAHREDGRTACEVVCPTRAIAFGDLDDPESSVSKILDRREVHRLNESSGANSNIYYLAP